jgi:MFS family permease
MAGSAVARGLRGYGALLSVPGVRPVILWGLLARVPFGMSVLAMVFMVRATGGSYADAGIVTGANTVAVALGAPIAGRLIDRGRPKTVLLTYGLLCPALTVVLAVLAWRGAPLWGLAVAAAAAGAANPPIGPAIRKLWPRLVAGEDQRRAAFAFEATVQEVIFVIGPLVVGAAVALFGWGAGLLLSALLSLCGVLGFVFTRAVRSAGAPAPGEHAHRHILAALSPPGVRRVIIFSAGFGVAFGGVEVALPAFAEGHGGRALASFALAAWSAGSLAGGLLAAGSGREPYAALRMTSLAFTAVLLLPLVATSLPMMAAFMFLAGLPIAPSFAITYGLVEDSALPGTQAEVFGWLSMAIVAGFAGGTALGGTLITHAGIRASILLAVVGAATAAGVAWRPRPAAGV